MSLKHTIATTLLEAPSVSVRFVTSCFVIGTSLLGALLSSARLQLHTEIICLLLQGSKNHKDDWYHWKSGNRLWEKWDKSYQFHGAYHSDGISYLIEIAVTVECMADLLESCLASVIIHWKSKWQKNSSRQPFKKLKVTGMKVWYDIALCKVL